MPLQFPLRESHGEGHFDPRDFASIGANVVFEAGVMIFHPENIRLGCNVYIGHQTILKGYHKNLLEVGDNTWVGQQCFVHSAGGVMIGRNVGVGPGVKIISSYHEEQGRDIPILASRLAFAPVTIEEDCDLGVGAIVLPGVHIGKGVQVGAGSVVNKDIPAYAVVAGVPARVLRLR
ncbi:MAG: acyltransferase [Acidobacteria bacterium]|nr:acyltransferase [Acidobacteriota bacterium]